MASEIDRGSSMDRPVTRVPDRQPEDSTRSLSGVVADPAYDPVPDVARHNATAGAANAGQVDPGPDAVPVAERMLLVARHTRMVPIGSFEVPGAIRPIPQPEGWTDILTGTDGPRFWDRIVLSEQARVGRYHRPVTIAYAEI